MKLLWLIVAVAVSVAVEHESSTKEVARSRRREGEQEIRSREQAVDQETRSRRGTWKQEIRGREGAGAEEMKSVGAGGQPEITTEEDRGTGPPVEDGVPFGPSLGAVLTKFSYVVIVSLAVQTGQGGGAAVRCIFNRPGVAGAVLQTPLSLIHCLTD